MTTTPQQDEVTQQVPWRGLIAAIAAISVAAAGFGHSLPFFSLLLESYGASDFVIGLNSGTAAVAAVLVTPVIPKTIERMGSKPFLILCIAGMILSYIGIYLAGERISLWYIWRFIFGAAGAGLFAASEIWINALAPTALRGRIIGIYGTFLALGFALGPFLVATTGFLGAVPFIAGIAVFASAIGPILIGEAPPASPEKLRSDFFGLIRRAPATFTTAALFAGLESAVLVFLPVLAVDQGWGAEIGAKAVSAYGFGIVAFQYVIGRAADRIGYARSLLYCSLAAASAGVLFLVGTGSIPFLFTILFIWGGLIAGLYTIGLVLVGDRMGGPQLAAANTGFVFMYGIGAILGPVIGGAVRQTMGADALSAALVGVLVIYAAFVFTRRGARIP